MRITLILSALVLNGCRYGIICTDGIDDPNQDLLDALAEIEDLEDELAQEDTGFGEEPDYCDEFYIPFDSSQTTSYPIVTLMSDEVYAGSYLSSRIASSMGHFFTASGCGSGYKVQDVMVKLSKIPLHEDTILGGTGELRLYDESYSTEYSQVETCFPVSDGLSGDGELHCRFYGVNAEVLSQHNGLPFEFILSDLPEVPVETEMIATVYVHWVDIDTSNGYVFTNSWTEYYSGSIKIIAM